MSSSLRGYVLGAAASAVIALAAPAAWAVKVGPVEDPVRVVKIDKGQPMVFGIYTVLSGADVGQGLDPYRGIQVAAADMGDKLLGHPIRLIAEDEGCNAEGGQTAATKLAANQQMIIALGSSCSPGTIPAAPILWRAGIPDISFGAASPYLTDPQKRGPGFEGFSRTYHNAQFQGMEMAKWAYETKKIRNAAAIHDGTAYTEGLSKAFAAEFQRLGGKIVSMEAINAQDSDMRPMLTRLITTKPELVFFPTYIAATAHIIQQAKEIPGYEKVLLMGTDNVIDKNFLVAAGKAAVGFQIISPPLDKESQGKVYAALLEKYKKKFGEDPTTPFAGYGYDTFQMAVNAIKKVAVQEKDGTTYIPISKLQAAIMATKDLQGITGTISCDKNGDCAKFVTTLYEFVSADPETFDVGKNPKRIYPAK
ncbi:MAG: branched-chain amino acid ABC transporter substrate-binding protein [Alphaproteobacteria bacterium]